MWVCRQDGVQASLEDLGWVAALHSERQRYHRVGWDGIWQNGVLCYPYYSKTTGQPATLLCPGDVAHPRALRADFGIIWSNWVVDRAEDGCFGGWTWYGVASYCSVEESARYCGDTGQGRRSLGEHEGVSFEEVEVPGIWWGRPSAQHGLWKTNQHHSHINT